VTTVLFPDDGAMMEGGCSKQQVISWMKNGWQVASGCRIAVEKPFGDGVMPGSQVVYD